MATIMSGTEVSQILQDEFKEKVKQLKGKGVEPCLAVIQVGENPASSVYVRNKKNACEYVGIRSLSYHLPENTSEDNLVKLIKELNDRTDVHGILVQLPLPEHINEDSIIQAIAPQKDVDGFHLQNVGALNVGQSCFAPCTPSGVIELLKRYYIEIEGKECVVVGRSNIVGKPMAQMLLKENGTVTICHSKTKNLKEITNRADILVVALGSPKFITKEYVKEDSIVIDVGINRDENGKMCGDVDFEDVFDKVAAITPVPGGVGKMTISMLLKNCIQSAEAQLN